MKKIVFLLFLFPLLVFTQEEKPQYTFDLDYYYGSILPHSQKIYHLIKAHPEGVFIAANKKTFGHKEWESRLNYPDYGMTFHYQNNKNQTLGDLYGLFLHYNFYFLNRNLQIRIAQGIAHSTNPYHKHQNYRNLAYGLNFMPVTFFMFSYQKENIWEGLGINAGVFLIHHSNAKLRTPNTSTNTVAAKFGIQYKLDHEKERKYIPKEEKDTAFFEPFRVNFALRTGVHESHVIGSGRYPFYNISAYADKKISKSSSFQLGVDLLLSRMRKKEIKTMGEAFPEKDINPEADYKRVGAFIGYELFINKLSFEPQLGYFIYNKYGEDKAIYQRLGLKYYLHKNFFTGFGLLSQSTKAEALEFTFGVRL